MQNRTAALKKFCNFFPSKQCLPYNTEAALGHLCREMKTCAYAEIFMQILIAAICNSQKLKKTTCYSASGMYPCRETQQ